MIPGRLIWFKSFTQERLLVRNKSIKDDEIEEKCVGFNLQHDTACMACHF